MAQIFPKWVNRTPLLALAGLGVGALAAHGLAWYYFSPLYTDVGYQPEQPVAYSHRLHAGELQIDCRFCHYTVERSAVASVPPTEVCMDCHKVVKRDSPAVAPVVASASDGTPIRWVRVHKIPEYAYFDHSVHVAAGVGCASCHGRVDQMEVVRQDQPLSMRWCLDCHRDPTDHLREADAITDMEWTPPPEQVEIAARLETERSLAPPVDCTACHR